MSLYVVEDALCGAMFLDVVGVVGEATGGCNEPCHRERWW